MKVTTSCLIIILSYFMCSCSNSNSERKDNYNQYITKTVKQWYGREIKLPRKLLITYKYDSVGTDFDHTFKQPLKIVNYVDGTCGACVVKLQHWKAFIDKAEANHAKCDFVFYIHAFDRSDFEKQVFSKMGLNICWIYDPDESYIQQNNMTDPAFETALLNQKNQVILIGSIAYRPKLEQLYQKLILDPKTAHL